MAAINMRRRVGNRVDVRGRMRNRVQMISMSLVISVRRRVRHVVIVSGCVGNGPLGLCGCCDSQNGDCCKCGWETSHRSKLPKSGETVKGDHNPSDHSHHPPQPIATLHPRGATFSICRDASQNDISATTFGVDMMTRRSPKGMQFVAFRVWHTQCVRSISSGTCCSLRHSTISSASKNASHGLTSGIPLSRPRTLHLNVLEEHSQSERWPPEPLERFPQ